ncbi:hypothetical protein M9979_12210 [Sphingomonas sp. RP10(2022)]|uniref:Uncharacterized protein n=1 Tax=Sphingomonas liriopis TaxID=2949094 RepID=A0A9X2HTK8_9SPHN|nr:hypothetical protein [Sphingomonas liriopis]MCP3735637.1 hypothetical protein [Sphingomonas liriopis]
MRKPNWAWPNERIYPANFMVRAGRIVHWLALGLAALVLLIGVVGLVASFLREPPAPNVFDQFTPAVDPRPQQIATCIEAIVFAPLIALVGRSFRYLLAGE